MDADKQRREAGPATTDHNNDGCAAPGRAHPLAKRYAALSEAMTKRTSADGDSSVSSGEVVTAAVEARGSGTPVPDGVRGRAEAELGVGLGHVKVHQDPVSQQANAAIGARLRAQERRVSRAR